MPDDMQEFELVARKPIEDLRAMKMAEVQEKMLALVTDIEHRRPEKLQLLAGFFVKVFTGDMTLFLEVFAPFLDVMRNDASIDIFSHMLDAKTFNTTSLQSVLLALLNRGDITVFEIEHFLPQTASKAKQLALLGKMLKHAQDGILKDTFMDLFLKTLMPGSTFDMKPENFMSMEFMSEMTKSLQQLAFFYRKGYPVSDILAHVGEQQGPQMVLFIMLMLSQGILREEETTALLDEMDNEMFTSMFRGARENMKSMLPPGFKGAGAAGAGGLPFAPPGMAGRVAGSSIFQRIARKLLGIFGRFQP